MYTPGWGQQRSDIGLGVAVPGVSLEAKGIVRTLAQWGDNPTMTLAQWGVNPNMILAQWGEN